MRRENSKRNMILASAALAAIGFANHARAAQVFWDADGNTTAATGGAGSWDLTSSLWRPGSSTGTPLQTWTPNDGTVDTILGGTAGTLTLATDINANSLQFSSAGSYNIVGGGAAGNTLTVGTIRSSSSAQQILLTKINGVGGVLTIENNNTAAGADGATNIALKGMTSMEAGTLTQLNIGGAGAGGSYQKVNQVSIWNPHVDPFAPGVTDPGSRNAWNVLTAINFTGDYGMLTSASSTLSGATTGTPNFSQQTHLNSFKAIFNASAGHIMNFNQPIDGVGGSVAVEGQGAVVYNNAMTYTGETRILNAPSAGGFVGILRFGGSNALPTSTAVVFGGPGFTNVGAINLQGTNQQIGSLSTDPGATAIGFINNVGNSTAFHNTLTVSGSATTTYASPIGTGATLQAGGGDGIQLVFPASNTGSTTLTYGSSTYADGTIISGGTVISKNTVNNTTGSPVGVGAVTVSGTSTSQYGTFGGTGKVLGAVTQNAFSHLAPGGVGTLDTTNQLTLSSGVTLAGTSNVDFDFNAFGNDTVNANALALTGVDTGANRVVINMFDQGAGVHNGTFTLVNYTSETGGNNAPAATNYVFNPPAGFNAAHFTLNDTGSALTLTVTGEAQDITWTGNVSPNWNTTQQNFKTASGPVVFNNDRVIFNDDSPSTTNVTVAAGGVSPAVVSINSNAAYTFSGGSVTSFALSKSGSGTATINNAQSYVFGAVVSGGTINISPTGSISGGAMAFSGGSTLEVNTTSNISGVASFSFTDSILRADGQVAINQPITMSGTGIGLDVDTQANNVTFGGVVTGPSTSPLEKDGSGTLLFSTPTAMSGPITVNGGTLAMALGTTGITTGAITVNSGGTVSFISNQAGYTAKALGLTLKDNSTIKFSGESGLLGGTGILFDNVTFAAKNVYIQGADNNSRFVTRNFLKGTFSEPDAGTTVHLTGAGNLHVGSGSLSVVSSNTEFSGTWQLDNGFTGVLSVGPILNTNATEILVGPGYNPGLPAGPTRPVIVNSGTLAVGADARNTRTGTANAATNISGAFRSAVTLGGGNIASTGREYGTGSNQTGATGDASSNVPVTAMYAGDITLADGTTSKVLLYDPIPIENYGNNPDPTNTGDPTLNAQNINPIGSRNLRFVTDIPTSNGGTPGRADVPSNFNWGNNTTLVVDSGATTGGVLSFERSTTNPGGASVNVGSNDTLQINTGGTVNLAGTTDALASGSNFVNVVNNGGLHVSAGTKNIGLLSGTGNSTIDATTTLVVNEVTSTSTGAFTGGGTLTKNNAGVLTAASVRTGALNVTAGGVKIAVNGTSTGTSKVGALNLSGSTTLDLTNNKLIVSGGTLGTLSGSTYSGITGQVQAGRNGGAWNGSGIITSQAQAQSPSILTTLAVGSNADLHKTTFGGQAVTSSDILVMYTYAGDANLDGKIDADDYFQIDSNLNKAATTFNYTKGDFNYDGKVNGDDYFIIDSNFPNQSPPFPAAAPLGDSSASALAGVAAVPEPASLTGLLAVAGLSALRRRRRQQA